MLMTEAPIALEALGHERADDYRRVSIAPLEGGAVGTIDRTRSRSLATLGGVRRIPGPTELQTICVAEDGRTTFAKSSGKNESEKLWRAERFDAPLELIGERPTSVGNGLGPQQARWTVHSEAGTLLVECQAARVERITGRVRDVALLRWTDAIQLFRARPEANAPQYCLLRTNETQGFVELPNCSSRVEQDGSIVVERMPMEGSTAPRVHKPSLPACLFMLDRGGKRLECSAPLEPVNHGEVRDRRERASLQSARFYAKNQAVVPSTEQGLFRLGTDIRLDPANRIGPESLGHCVPLLSQEPVFSCAEPELDVVVSVEAQGTLKLELRRPRRIAEDADRGREARFSHTTDGGLVLAGDCEGTLSEAACLRDCNGTWRTIHFSKQLISALNRTAPATQLIPTPDGRLYVATGTMDGGGGFGLSRGISGEIRILIFQADQGEPSSVKNLPAWIVEKLADLVDRPTSSTTGDSPDLSFSGAQRIRAWPLKRKHPALGTTEHCRVDIALDGSFETECIQGRLFAVGQLGLLQKQLNEVYETLNAGGTWTKISLPKGLETEEILCTPIGCRLGPYWRAGWGEPSPSAQ